jgi:F0F1-type ATP synthase assembly protein I
MRRIWRIIDRAAGKVYARILAVVTAVISAVMLISALFSWRLSGPVGGLVWLLGALVFGVIARAAWRSRAALSDVDFTV